MGIILDQNYRFVLLRFEAALARWRASLWSVGGWAACWIAGSNLVRLGDFC
jgi:hypothetical protein